MASQMYNNEDNIGGGGIGGMGGIGGGGIGIIILLFLFFAIFCGGGLFGKHGDHSPREHSGQGGGCGGVSNCQIDKDVVVSALESKAGILAEMNANQSATIANQNAIQAYNQAETLSDWKMRYFQEKCLNDNQAQTALLMAELAKKANAAPIFAASVTQCLNPVERPRDNNPCWA
jgi:hypothetical protein